MYVPPNMLPWVLSKVAGTAIWFNCICCSPNMEQSEQYNQVCHDKNFETLTIIPISMSSKLLSITNMPLS